MRIQNVEKKKKKKRKKNEPRNCTHILHRQSSSHVKTAVPVVVSDLRLFHLPVLG